MTTKPAPKWNFQVDFVIPGDPEVTNEILPQSDSLLLSQSVYSIKIPELNVENFDTWFPGMKFTYPGKPKIHGNNAITFYDDQKFSIRRILDKLMKLNYNPRYNWNDSFDVGYEDYVATEHHKLLNEPGHYITPRVDIYIRIFDCFNDYEYVKKIVLKNCFISAISGQELSYDSNEAVEVTATFNYPYFKVLEIAPEEKENYENIEKRKYAVIADKNEEDMSNPSNYGKSFGPKDAGQLLYRAGNIYK